MRKLMQGLVLASALNAGACGLEQSGEIKRGEVNQSQCEDWNAPEETSQAARLVESGHSCEEVMGFVRRRVESNWELYYLGDGSRGLGEERSNFLSPQFQNQRATLNCQLPAGQSTEFDCLYAPLSVDEADCPLSDYHLSFGVDFEGKFNVKLVVREPEAQYQQGQFAGGTATVPLTDPGVLVMDYYCPQTDRGPGQNDCQYYLETSFRTLRSCELEGEEMEALIAEISEQMEVMLSAVEEAK